MGNLLLRIAIAVAALITIVMAIGSFLPRNYSTTVRIRIQAEPERIFPYINRLKSWAAWSTSWNPHDIPDLKIEYGAKESGTDAVQTWTEPRGSGKLWITASVEPERVSYQSTFGNFPVMRSSIQLDGQNGNTEVIWTSTGSLPSGPFYGWFGRTFSNQLAIEYEKSLTNLKNLVESKVRSDPEETTDAGAKSPASSPDPSAPNQSAPKQSAPDQSAPDQSAPDQLLPR